MNKHLIILFALFCAFSTTLFAQNDNDQLGQNLQIRCIAFYNLENLFDTIHDEGKNDYEYLPDGGMKWTSIKYENKIHNMAYAISQLGTDYDPRGAAIVGVCEVENMGCMQDLCRELRENCNRNYEPILVEGPDRRGVDCGLLYNPELFKVTNVRGHELNGHYPDGGTLKTRLQLLVSGYIVGQGRPEKIHVVVNHWPSPFGGKERTEPVRDTAALLCRAIADSIYQREPNAKIIIMGDLNEDPHENACANVMGARQYRKDVEPKGFFNTMWQHLENGNGSIFYMGNWDLFDQIMISEPLLNEPLESGKWTYWKSQVFNKPFLTTQQGKFKGGPFRTTQSGVWQNGYGDHYPTMIYLIRK